jgi:hypothetical protein
VEWFQNLGNNYPWESKPQLNYFSMKWALGFKKFKDNFDDNFDKWKADESIAQLKKEIEKMLLDGYAKKPNSFNKITEFGPSLTDGQLVDKEFIPEETRKLTIKKVPLFDKYYYTNFKYKESIKNEVNDFFGAIANCNIRFAAKGYLEFIDQETTKVIINELGVYI